MANRFSWTAFNGKEKRPSRILAESFPWDNDQGWMLRPPLGEVHIRLLRIDRHWKGNFLCSGVHPEHVNNEGVTKLRDTFDLGFAAERDGDRETAASAYARCYGMLRNSVTARSSWSSTFWDAVWLMLWAAIGFLPWRQLGPNASDIASFEECMLVLCYFLQDLLPKAGELTIRLRTMMALVFFDYGYATGREQDVIDAMDMVPFPMALEHYFHHYRTPRVMLCLWLRNQHSFLGNYSKVLFWEQERSKWAGDDSVPPFGPRPKSIEAGNFGTRALEFYEEEVKVAMGKPDAAWIPDPDAWIPDLETVERMLPEMILEVPGGQALLGDNGWRGEGALGADWFLLDDTTVMRRHRDLQSDLAEMPSLKNWPTLFDRIAESICRDGNTELEEKLLAALRHWRGLETSGTGVPQQRKGPGFNRGYFLFCEIVLDLKNGSDLDAGDLDAIIAKLEAAIAAFTEHVDVLKAGGDTSFRVTCLLLSECYWRICMCWRDRYRTGPWAEQDPDGAERLKTDERCADGLRRFIQWRNMALDYVCARPAAFDIHSDHHLLGLAHCALAMLTYTSRHRLQAASNRQQKRSAFLAPDSAQFLPATPEEVEGMGKAIQHHAVCTQILSSILSQSRQFGERLLGWSPSTSYQSMHDIHLWLQLIDPVNAVRHLKDLRDLLVRSERCRVRTLVLQLEALLPPGVPRCLCPPETMRHQHRGIYSNDECGRNFVEQTRLACGSQTVFLEYNITGNTMSRFLEAEQLTIHVLYPGEKGYHVVSPGPVRWFRFQDKGMEDFHDAMSHVESYQEMGGSPGVALYLEHLHRVLIDPVDDVLSRMAVTDKLVISPCGDLNRVPFALLRRARDGKYLFERHTVSVTPSFLALGLSLQLQGQKKQQNSEGDGLVFGGVVADPFYFQDSKRLLESGREMEMIRGLFHHTHVQEVVCLQGRHASPEGLLSLAGRCKGFLHVAAHAEADSGGIKMGEHDSTQEGEPPNRGALLLAEGDEESLYQGGILKAEDIMFNNSASLGGDSALATSTPRMWLPQLVVLSACDSGNGQIRDDGLVNLPRAIIGAGVPSVVASLWKVGDTDCVDVMTVFYTELHNGEDVTTALRSTMMHFKDDPHVYRWAAFQAWGVPSTCLQAQASNRKI